MIAIFKAKYKLRALKTIFKAKYKLRALKTIFKPYIN